MSLGYRARTAVVLVTMGVVGSLLIWGQAAAVAQYGRRTQEEPASRPPTRSSRGLANEREAARPKTVQAKLDKVIEQQAAILAQLAKVKAELQIVKIRATLR